MISVIVPVYNVENYLRKCIASIQKQTYTDLEIILVDDGSTDCSGKICDELAAEDSRIIVIHQENGGLSRARNAGLHIANGDYISFVDSDDTIEMEMMQKLLSGIYACKADICMCGSRTITETGKVLAVECLGNQVICDIDTLFSKVILPLRTASWNKLYSRKIALKGDFPVGKIHGEDLVYILSIVDEHTRLSIIDYIGYNYYKRGNSITTMKFNAKSFDEVWCKDKATEIIQSRFPTFYLRALNWPFKARMNMLRKIILSCRYRNQFIIYMRWLIQYETECFNSLSIMRKTEYLFYKIVYKFK